jgi:hypothetical protein
VTFWRLALRNLGRNRKRNLATGSAIAFGFAGILLLAAYGYRARNYIRVYTIYVVHTGHLAIFAPGGFENFAFRPGRYSLSREDQARAAGKASSATAAFPIRSWRKDTSRKWTARSAYTRK